MNQGTEWGLLMKKTRSQKSRASVPLRGGRRVVKDVAKEEGLSMEILPI
jgi:hypothetical protein